MARIKGYQFEIESILSKIKEFEDGIGTKKTAENLKHEFTDLMVKIAKDEPGLFDENK